MSFWQKDQPHIQGTFASCHVSYSALIWCTTANAGLDCLAEEELSWSLNHCVTFFPLPCCALWKEAIVLSHGKEWGLLPTPQEWWTCANHFKYSAWLLGSYFPCISVINHLSLALSICGLLTPLFYFLSWSSFGHWSLLQSCLVFLWRTTVLCFFWLFPHFLALESTPN